MSGQIDLPAKRPVTLVRLTDAPSTLRLLQFSVPREHADIFARARLRVTWDNRAFPSIDAPVSQFFGAGTLYNNSNREFLVKGIPMTIRFDGERVHLICQFPMPFFRAAHIELVGHGGTYRAGQSSKYSLSIATHTSATIFGRRLA